MREIIDMLTCVCFNCSRIIADRSAPAFKAALRVRNPMVRLKRMSAVCKGKT
jgi:DNA-directed RNA polymerase II subunit RPB1